MYSIKKLILTQQYLLHIIRNHPLPITAVLGITLFIIKKIRTFN